MSDERSPLSELSVKTAEDIGTRKNVAGVIVVVIGNDGDAGSALLCPGVDLDTLIAITVQMLGALRADDVEREVKQPSKEGS